MGIGSRIVACGLASAAVALMTSTAFAQKAVAGKTTFRASIIDGSVPPATTGSAGDYMENGPRQETGHGTHGTLGAPKPTVKRERRPAVELPRSNHDAPAPKTQPDLAQPLVKRDPALKHETGIQSQPKPGLAVIDQGGAKDEGAETGAPRQSMMKNLSSPMQLPTAKIEEASDDEAAQLSRNDYESHILGGKAKPKVTDDPLAPSSQPIEDSRQDASQPGQAPVAAPQRDATDLAALNPGKPGEIFVTVDIDLKSDPNQYRDAVAGLAARAQFRPDARFEPAFSAGGPARVSVAGWIPGDQLAAALQVPSVLKLETAPRSAPRIDNTAVESSLLVGIRVPGTNPSAPEARGVVQAVLRDLSAMADFHPHKEVGFDPIPGGKDSSVMVAGKAPTKALGRIMGHPSVVKTAPWIEPEAPAARQDGEISQFLSFAFNHSPLLFAVTALMGLWSVAWALVRFAEISIPYR